MSLNTHFSLLTINFGMTNGGECRVTRWTENGSEQVARFCLEWDTAPGEKWYRPSAVATFWETPRAELGDWSLRQLIAEHSAVSVTYWGADLAFLDGDKQLVAAANYPCLYESPELLEKLRTIDSFQWHSELGGALNAPHQPICNIDWVVNHLKPAQCQSIRFIVPMSDYLVHFLLCRSEQHDADMLQSLGLGSEGALLFTHSALRSTLSAVNLCPWPVSSEKSVGEVDGCKVVFATHDSVMARLLGLHASDFTIWSGSWCGVGAAIDGLNISPGAATHAAGLSFEGLHPRVMQKNTGMFGPAYRELLKRAELTYDTAAAGLSTEEPPEPGFSLQSSILAGKSGPEAADIVLGSLPAEKRSAKRAAVELIRLAANECLADLRALAGICGRPLQRVSVVGGFAENQLFLKLLREDGIEVVIPPHAAAGADMATAVETIRRLQLAAGNAQSFAEILAAMP